MTEKRRYDNILKLSREGKSTERSSGVPCKLNNEKHENTLDNFEKTKLFLRHVK